MQEGGLRKLHRSSGIILVWFLAIQAVTGLLLSLGWLLGTPDSSPWFSLMATLHHEWNPVGSIYRILLALLTAWQGITGIIIFSLIRARTRQASGK